MNSGAAWILAFTGMTRAQEWRMKVKRDERRCNTDSRLRKNNGGGWRKGVPHGFPPSREWQGRRNDEWKWRGAGGMQHRLSPSQERWRRSGQPTSDRNHTLSDTGERATDTANKRLKDIVNIQRRSQAAQDGDRLEATATSGRLAPPKFQSKQRSAATQPHPMKLQLYLRKRCLNEKSARTRNPPIKDGLAPATKETHPFQTDSSAGTRPLRLSQFSLSPGRGEGIQLSTPKLT